MHFEWYLLFRCPQAKDSDDDDEDEDDLDENDEVKPMPVSKKHGHKFGKEGTKAA